MKNHIIIASHGGLARGMADTAGLFGVRNVTTIEQTMEETGFEERARQILEQYKDENIVVFTDILGGSVNQSFFKHLRDRQFHLVTGMNLAVILECIFAVEPITDEFLRNAISQSREQLCYMNDIFNAAQEDEDDD